MYDIWVDYKPFRKADKLSEAIRLARMEYLYGNVKEIVAIGREDSDESLIIMWKEYPYVTKCKGQTCELQECQGVLPALQTDARVVANKFYSHAYPESERRGQKEWPNCVDPHLAKAQCGFDCGRPIGDFQDDCGEFCTETPNGYTGICKTCWGEHGCSTAER